jgi:hypothetical protein
MSILDVKVNAENIRYMFIKDSGVDGRIILK